MIRLGYPVAVGLICCVGPRAFAQPIQFDISDGTRGSVTEVAAATAAAAAAKVTCQQEISLLAPGLRNQRDSGGQQRSPVASEPKSAEHPEPAAPSMADSDGWTTLEHSVWNHLCGRQSLKQEDWPTLLHGPRDPTRSIRASLIRAILASNKFDIPGYNRIAIDGAHITGNFDLQHEILRSELALTNCEIDGPVDFDFLRTDFNIDFRGTNFFQSILATRMSIGGSLLFGNDKEDAMVPSDWKIPMIDLTDSVIKGKLQFDAMRVQGRFMATNLKASEFDISNSALGYLVLYGGELGQLQIRHSLFGRASNDGLLPDSLDQYPEAGDYSLEADKLYVAHSLLLDRTFFTKPIVIADASVGGDLSLRGSTLHSLDLTGTVVHGNFLIGEAANQGNDAPDTGWFPPIAAKRLDKLTVTDGESWANRLLNAKYWLAERLGVVDKSISDTCDSGSSSLILEHFRVGLIKTQLNDFSYWPCLIRLGSFEWGGVENATDDLTDPEKMRERSFTFTRAFLNRSRFSPDAYDHARGLFVRAGMDKEGDSIGEEKKNREFNNVLRTCVFGSPTETCRGLRVIELLLSRSLIDYGYNTWFAAVWAAFFVVFGGFVFNKTEVSWLTDSYKASKIRRFGRFGWGYSFDMLLPIIKLREAHYQVDIKEQYPRYYFYFHKIMGFVLGSFLAAGVSGLTH